MNQRYLVFFVISTLGIFLILSLPKHNSPNTDIRITKAADYMIRHQNLDGLFDYEYNVDLDNYSASDNIVRQAGAAYSLAQAANYARERKYFETSKKSADRLIALTQIRREGNGDFRFLPYEGKILTNANALLMLAILELVKFDDNLLNSYSKVLEELANHILAAETKDGFFWNSYNSNLNQYIEKQDDYTNGESLLALIELYKVIPDEKYLKASIAAADVYLMSYGEEWNKAFYAWGVKGMVGLYDVSADAKYKDFVFRLSDIMLATEYFTGGKTQISLGVFIEGLVPVYQLARAEKDWDRAEAYRKATEYGLAKLYKLQILGQGALSDQIFKNAEGGFCFDTNCKKIRIDNVQHGLAAIVAASSAEL